MGPEPFREAQVWTRPSHNAFQHIEPATYANPHAPQCRRDSSSTILDSFSTVISIPFTTSAILACESSRKPCNDQDGPHTTDFQIEARAEERCFDTALCLAQPPSTLPSTPMRSNAGHGCGGDWVALIYPADHALLSCQGRTSSRSPSMKPWQSTLFRSFTKARHSEWERPPTPLMTRASEDCTCQGAP